MKSARPLDTCSVTRQLLPENTTVTGMCQACVCATGLREPSASRHNVTRLRELPSFATSGGPQ